MGAGHPSANDIAPLGIVDKDAAAMLWIPCDLNPTQSLQRDQATSVFFGVVVILNAAWDDYGAWAARARALQASTRKWNGAALFCAATAAVFGAAATTTTVVGYTNAGKAFSFIGAAAAALTPILGREMLAIGSEAQWIRARVTAEAIKSECYRFAARAGDYAGANAEDNFTRRCDEFIASRDHAPGMSEVLTTVVQLAGMA
jgi:hypothetical protein